MRRGEPEGFTLIELLVVASVISIIASIAVPSFVKSRASANEGAVVATLKSVAKAQFQFKTLNLVDADGNGGFEYGTLGEITGALFLRGSTEKLAPRLMSVSLGATDADGRIERHGYVLALYLPDAAGNGLAETPGNVTNISPVLAQDYWTMVAWPAHEAQGRATYFVNQQGQILRTVANYAGSSVVPPPGCALVGLSAPERIDGQNLAISETGADGNTWIALN